MRLNGTLIFFCGKMGAGKSTLSKKIAHERGAVLISEDEWLATLFSGEVNDFADYRKYAARLKSTLKPHVEQILLSGTSVVMDFPGNTQAQRAWFKSIFSPHDIPHELHYLNADDAQCLRQLEMRKKQHPERARFDTAETFEEVTRYFEPPVAAEGFNVEISDRNAG